MKIPQPNRSGADDACAFMALCPSCSKLLVIEDGRWPDHRWEGPDSLACPLAGYPHITVVKADGSPT